MTSDRTWATCPGAAAASTWKPWSVRMAFVNRPSAEWGPGAPGPLLEPLDQVRQPRSDALVTSASELIRILCSGLPDSMASTWYSTILRFESG